MVDAIAYFYNEDQLFQVGQKSKKVYYEITARTVLAIWLLKKLVEDIRPW